MITRWLVLTALASVVLGCGVSRRLPADAECELTSQCDVPLVCRLGRCRAECATSSDCSVGLSCVRDADGLGACQAASERTCLLASECPAPLVCRYMQCVNECAEDRDCLGGARCVDAPAGVCIDSASFACSLDTDCVEAAEMAGRAQFCFDGRCREACHTDRDCRNLLLCDPVRGCYDPTIPFDAGPALVDAGPIDAPALDAPLDAGVSVDGGPGVCAGGPLAGALSISHSRETVCALSDDGSGARRLYCWGQAETILGLAPGSGVPCATEVTTLGAFVPVEIAVGSSFVCMRNGIGEVACIGSNNSVGDLGLGLAGDVAVTTPMVISGLTATSIAAGTVHACATIAGGGVSCWGEGRFGMLGDMGTANQPSPVPAGVATGMRSLELGRQHSCGLDATGGPFCWGNDFMGALGNGGGTYAASAARWISAGGEHSCAVEIAGTGTVFCWGWDGTGALGDGMADGVRTTREAVVGLPGPASRVTGGEGFTCALVGTDVWCWGFGAGIDGTTDTILTPERVFTGASDVRAGSTSTCALIGDGVACVGQNDSGELGDGTLAPSATPRTVLVR